MKLKTVGKKMVLEIQMDTTPQRSSSGKSYIVASDTATMMRAEKPVRVNVSAFITIPKAQRDTAPESISLD